jgi:hypothetical protein
MLVPLVTCLSLQNMITERDRVRSVRYILAIFSLIIETVLLLYFVLSKEMGNEGYRATKLVLYVQDYGQRRILLLRDCYFILVLEVVSALSPEFWIRQEVAGKCAWRDLRAFLALSQLRKDSRMSPRKKSRAQSVCLVVN